MILVRRDPNQIPAGLLAIALRAQAELEQLPHNKHKAFIKKKGHIWRRFARYLAKMAYGKCWYSESKDIHTFQDVDHFRPKQAAKRANGVEDDGYPWLAFSWDNFRYSSQRANRPGTDEETQETTGKASWFPLLTFGKKADWNDRCINDERPVLLDPTVLADVRLIEVTASGHMGPTRICQGAYQRDRVIRSIKLLGLDLPGIVEARQAAMRTAQGLIDDIHKAVDAAEKVGELAYLVAETIPNDEKLSKLQDLTRPHHPLTAAVRAQLRESGYGELCLREEEFELQ